MKLQVDFDALAASPTNAMRKVTALMQRAGTPVLDVACDLKPRRVAGITYREVKLSFGDSQTLTLRIKATGDVYQVLLNGKLTPVKEQDDPAKAADELSGLLNANRGRFQKRLAALAMKPPPGIKTAAPRLLDTLQAQVQELDTQIASAREELATLQA